MKRYTQANQEIIPPRELVGRTVAGAQVRHGVRGIALIAAAVLLLSAMVGVAAWQMRGDDLPLPPVDDTAIAPDTTGISGTTGNSDETVSPEMTGTTEPASPSVVPLAFQLTNAIYPTVAQYPNDADYAGANGIFDSSGYQRALDAWSRDRKALRDHPVGYDAGLDESSVVLMRQFLTSTDKTANENRVLSPVNLYMALSMLTELTDGNSRAQLLNLLSADSVETVRSRAQAVWLSNYRSDSLTSTTLASSLWLNEQVNFRQSTLDILAEHYYASSFRGEMGSKTFDDALRSWINAQTGGLLQEEADALSLDPHTVLALATTVYYQARWEEEFSSLRNSEGVFYADSGEQTAVFMNSGRLETYYWGDGFGAIAKSLQGGGTMWLILPDEGVTPDQLLTEDDIYAMTLNGICAGKKRLIVNLAMPKFDVSAELDLKEGLSALGITDVFDLDAADFSPVTADAVADELFLSQAEHAVRVAVDEEGCTAAAYTMLGVAGAGVPPDEEIDFVLDRPFIFMITSDTDAVLFAGVVETMN